MGASERAWIHEGEGMGARASHGERAWRHEGENMEARARASTCGRGRGYRDEGEDMKT